MLAWVRILAFVPLAFAARIRRIERRTIERLQNAGANTAERSILLEPGGPIAEWVYGRLRRAGALQNGVNDRYYLDAAAYDTLRGRRRARAMVVIVILAAVLTASYLRGVFS